VQEKVEWAQAGRQRVEEGEEEDSLRRNGWFLSGGHEIVEKFKAARLPSRPKRNHLQAATDKGNVEDDNQGNSTEMG